MSNRFGYAMSALAALSTGCLYDADAPCGQNMELDDSDFCVCATGFGYSEQSAQCEACDPDTEVGLEGECACIEGMARRASTGLCEGAPPSLGLACESGVNDCADPEFSRCQSNSLDEGFCTSEGCQSSLDCFGDYVCEGSGPSAYCKAPPTGLLEPCEEQADCSNFEASHCEVAQGSVCLVRDCSLEPDDCHTGWECCDFSALSGLGLPPTMCVPTGECPF